MEASKSGFSLSLKPIIRRASRTRRVRASGVRPTKEWHKPPSALGPCRRDDGERIGDFLDSNCRLFPISAALRSLAQRLSHWRLDHLVLKGHSLRIVSANQASAARQHSQRPRYAQGFGPDCSYPRRRRPSFRTLSDFLTRVYRFLGVVEPFSPPISALLLCRPIVNLNLVQVGFRLGRLLFTRDDVWFSLRASLAQCEPDKAQD